MKSKFLLLFTFVLVLTSCNFTENINVKEDGSGTFALEMDGAGLMAMAGEKIGSELGAKNNAKSIDSTFSFKQIFEAKKDSIAKLSAEQQAALKKLESFVMKIKMNPEAKQLLFSMNTDFQKISDIQNMMDGIKTLKDLKGQSDNKKLADPINESINNNAKIDYLYNGKIFSRKAIVLKDQIKKIAADSLGMAKMIFASSKYTLKYHFPKAVKSVSNPDALFSADRKTITVEYPFTDYSENPEKLNLNVIFE